MFFCCFGQDRTIESDLDPRFGAPNISSPNEGAFHSPQFSSGPVIKALVSPQLPPKYTCGQVNDLANIDKKSPPLRPLSHETQLSNPSSGGQPSPELNKVPLHATSPMPVHQAYISDCSESVGNLTSGSASSYTMTPTTGGSAQIWPKFSPTSLYPQAKRSNPSPQVGLGECMSSEQQHSRPLVRLEPVPKQAGKLADRSPESAQSIEQWPGSW